MRLVGQGQLIQSSDAISKRREYLVAEQFEVRIFLKLHKMKGGGGGII